MSKVSTSDSIPVNNSALPRASGKVIIVEDQRLAIFC